MKKKPIKLQMDKFPYFKSIKDKITMLKMDIAILNARQPLLESELKNSSKTPLEKNYLQDEMNKLPRKLQRLHMDLNETEGKFKKHDDHLRALVADANANYDEIIEEGKAAIARGNQTIKEQFDQYSIYDFDDNWEARVTFYGTIRSLLKEEKNPSTPVD